MNIFIWLLLVGVIAFLWLRLNKKLYNDFLSPFNLLLPTWVIPILLCLLNFSAREPVWHFDSILMISYSTLMLSLISLLPAIVLPKNNSSNRENSSFKKMCLMVNGTEFTIYMTVIYILSCFAVVYNEIITNPTGGAPFIIFLLVPDISRDAGWLWKGDYWYLSVPVFALLPFYYIKVRMATSKLKKWFFVCLLIFYPVVALLKLSRSEIIYSVTGSLLMHYYWGKYNKIITNSKRLLFKNFLRISIVLTLAIVSSTYFHELRSANNFSEINEKSDMGVNIPMPEPFRSAFAEVYTYFAIPFHNFVQFVNEYDGGYHPGIGILRPVYSVLGMGSGVQKEIQIINFDSYLKMYPANTYPFLEVVYAEFGWIGILSAPVLYALLVNILYVLFRYKKDFAIVALYFTVIAYQWLWMFSNTNFTGVQYYMFGLFQLFFIVIFKVFFGYNNKNATLSSSL